MSRNIRHKSNLASPKKTAKRTSKISDNSSDDDYAGVDLISDSEEDEPDVEVAEEQAIIESAEDDEDDDESVSTPRPSIEDDQSNWDGFSVDASQDVLGDDLHFFDDHMARMHAPDHDTEATVWASKNIASGSPEPRRVRFNLSDSSSTASDNDDLLYPDLFMDQESLAPSFRKRIENDDDEQNPSSEDGSYWDFDGGEKPLTHEDDEASDSGDSTGSSGYETDSGDTTEEEDPPESIRKEKYLPPRSVLRRQSTDSGSEEEITVDRRVPARAIRGPRLGSWIHNASRPFAVINSDGNRLYMFKARVSRRYSHSDLHLRTSSAQESEGETLGDRTSPMVSNSGNLMLSAMYTPLGPYMNNLGDQAMGPPEAFYPFTSINANGEIIQDSPSSFDEDDLDDEELWDVEDFINFGDQSSDEDEGGEEAHETPRPTTATSEDQSHSNLLNPGIVGAFRKNQQKHKLMTRYNATVDSLVFAGPYAATTIRGIKDGRIAHAATAITPLRKQKPSPIDSSPLAAHSNKRKFSGEERGHKRNKSVN